MCQISNTIHFCNCKAKSIEQLKHYWALYRYDPDKNEHMMGEAIMPAEDDLFELNQATLLDLLNNQNPFDADLSFMDKDVFVVCLNNNDYENNLKYVFKYHTNEWKESSLDFFELENEFEEVDFGKLKSFRVNN